MDGYWNKNRLYIVIRQLERARNLLDDGSTESIIVLKIIDKRLNKYRDMISETNKLRENLNNHTRA